MGGGVWKGGKDEKNAGAAACREAKKDTKERVRKDFFFFSSVTIETRSMGASTIPPPRNLRKSGVRGGKI